MFLADGELVALCDSYYPAGLAQGTQIAQDRRIRGEVRGDRRPGRAGAPPDRPLVR